MKTQIQFLLILFISISMACTLPTQTVVPLTATQGISSGSVPATSAPFSTETATIQPSAISTPTPSFTPTSTLTPTPNVPTALFIMNANCRSGPNKTKDAVISFIKGDRAQILGRNNELDNTWWLVKIPNSKGKCWVSTVTVNVIGSYDDIPTIPPPY
jgi:hypothetical protein